MTRPRSGEPDGPAGMNRPSRAATTWVISSVVLTRRGTTSRAAKDRTAATSAGWSAATEATESRDQFASSIARTRARACSSTASAEVRVALDSSRPSASRRPGRAVVPPQIWRARRIARTRLTRASPVGAPPRTCRPSRIWASLTSHSQPSTCSRKSSKPSSSGRSSRPRSWSSFAAWIRVQIWARMVAASPGPSPRSGRTRPGAAPGARCRRTTPRAPSAAPGGRPGWRARGAWPGCPRPGR